MNITSAGVGVMTLSSSAVGGAANASAYISNLDLSSQSGSRTALDTIDSQMTMVSKTIGSIGASQSRLASALNTLDVARENSLAAASRILSVDIASESAELARRVILQQAGAAVLAQANQLPSLALQLLR